MRKTGVSDLPLHGGRCPPWLFKRMKRLSGLISEVIIYEYGQDEFLRRISNPYFFQSFGCVLGFDWHSSGVTTTTLGALKESLDPEKHGIAILGGKGRTSRKTPDEIEMMSQVFPLTENETDYLKYASRMSAKVDTSAVQDGYQLYHHNFILSEKGNFAVIQQGMNNETRYARRYHWLSSEIESFVNEPHTAICCDHKGRVLNMVSKENETDYLKYASRMSAKVDTSAVQDGYQLYHHNFVLSEKGNFAVIQQGMNNETRYARRYHWLSSEIESFVNEPHTAICCDHKGRVLNMVSKENERSRKVSVDIVKDSLGEVRKYLMMGRHHWIDNRVFSKLLDLKEFQPRDYEEILAFRGVGPKTIRALALTSKLIYGSELSWKDPVKFSFARGGKDGTPYPVDKRTYDEGNEILRNAIENARLGNKERLGAIRRLENFI